MSKELCEKFNKKSTKQKIHLNSTEQQNPRIGLKVNLTENSTKIKQNLKNQPKFQRNHEIQPKFKEICLPGSLSLSLSLSLR